MLLLDSLEKTGGSGRNRTDVHGFAGRCITTLPPSQRFSWAVELKPGVMTYGCSSDSKSAGMIDYSSSPNHPVARFSTECFMQYHDCFCQLGLTIATTNIDLNGSKLMNTGTANTKMTLISGEFCCV